MAISANTLFHFTDRQKLLSILDEKGFMPRFCLETLPNREIAIPMVCFCDIPLSQTKNHLKNYGYYGIGLNKEWGIKNKISPVLYIHKKSVVASSVAKSAKKVYGGDKGEKFPLIEFFEDIEMIYNFTKPYKGRLWREVKYKRIHFYDEREWRFVPPFPFEEGRFKYGMFKKDFFDKSLRAEANSIQKVLNFEANDIKYII